MTAESTGGIFIVVLRCLDCGSIHDIDSCWWNKDEAEDRVKALDTKKDKKFLADIEEKEILYNGN